MARRRKQILSRANLETTNRARKALIETLDGDREIIWAEIMEKSRAAENIGYCAALPAVVQGAVDFWRGRDCAGFASKRDRFRYAHVRT